MRVCLIGCVEFSAYALKTLIELENAGVIEIAGVVTKRKSQFNSDFLDLGEVVLKDCREMTPTHYYSDVGGLVEFIESVQADVVYCFGWSNLLTSSALRTAPKGVIGFHPAELPKNRGRHPIIWALALGLTETASTFFRMDEGADSGPILSQEKLSIAADDDARTLYDKIVQVAMKQIATFTEELAENRECFQEQDHSLANNWRKRSPKDGLIDWRMCAQDIHNLVRALTAPYPGAEFILGDGQLVKVWRTSVSSKSTLTNLEPGKVLDVNNGMVLVKCAGNTAVWLRETEPRLNVVVGEYL
jgi:methionyl-tRNA formyltransferase